VPELLATLMTLFSPPPPESLNRSDGAAERYEEHRCPETCRRPAEATRRPRNDLRVHLVQRDRSTQPGVRGLLNPSRAYTPQTPRLAAMALHQTSSAAGKCAARPAND
tara:strand:- start:246 stop:569 length:324 start_codon:yes stop_codon:yes gene_type:complete